MILLVSIQKNGVFFLKENKNGIGLGALTALVISSAIGSGVFGLMSQIASASAPGPAIIAWLIVGIGILALCLSLNHLVQKKPEIDGGIFGYAEAGYGKFAGFISGWGYWLSSWLGNVAFATMLMSSLGYFFPTFTGGQNGPSIVAASIVIWLLTILVNNGVESASFLNAIVTICKLVPIFVFIIFAMIAFDGSIFTADFWGNVSNNLAAGGKSVSMWQQIKGCIMIMLWVFVGIEGASVLASRATKKSDAGKATLLGLIGLLLVYMLVSLLPFGIMSQQELQAVTTQPSMAYVFERMVGSWGGAFVNIGLIISVLGCWLSWTMLPAETTLLMARDEMLPEAWGKKNAKNAPTTSLIITAILTNLFLLTFLVTDEAYNFALTLCTAAILISWLFAGLYQLKLAYQQKDKIYFCIGLIASAFQIMAIATAALQETLLLLIAYIPGIYLYYLARKSKSRGEVFSKNEKIAAVLITAGGVLAIILLIVGTIKI